MESKTARQLIGMARMNHTKVSDEKLMIALMNYTGSRDSLEYEQLIKVLLRKRKRFLRLKLGTTPDHLQHALAALHGSLPSSTPNALRQ